MNIHDWKVKYGDEIVAQVMAFVPNVAGNKVLTKALDGTVYIQTIGSGIKNAKIDILCTSEEIELVNEAEATGAVISAEYRGKIYIGYIEEQPEWETVQPGEWYKTTITLLIEEVVLRESSTT